MALCVGAASSQNLAVNDQEQAGDVTADQNLSVADVTDETVAVTTATANSYDAYVEDGDLDIESRQSVSGMTGAMSYMEVTGSSGAQTVTNTAATGNAADGGLYAGILNARVRQQTTGPSIAATSYIDAGEAETGYLSSNTQAIANSQGFGMEHGAGTMEVEQSNSSTVSAYGGADYNYVEDEAVVTASAAANNVTSNAIGDSTQTIAVTQENTGPVTEARTQTYYDNIYAATSQATASGNNVSIENETGPLSAAANQTNDSQIIASAESGAYDFGASTTIAYGVANSMVAGNYGEGITIDSTQFNGEDGAVDTYASFEGGYGYDASVSANSIGNASTAFACSDCQSTMDIANRQENQADIRAATQMSIGGSGRSISGTATAVGNTASYYVTRPSGS
ncbi:MAG TPA: holdfast anchor protein HfaD [Phenylobacterium sp.]|nr:holdfast anchor protein HfaD [Phenylobacterium sp.]